MTPVGSEKALSTLELALRPAGPPTYDARVGARRSFSSSSFEAHDDVLVAYLFGSVARGKAGPLSDVDVAALLAQDGDLFERFLEIAGEVARVVGSERADVVLLNDAPIALAYRVLREGRLILCRDERVRTEHWVRTVVRYLDMEPFLRTLEAGVRHRILESRFGRP